MTEMLALIDVPHFNAGIVLRRANCPIGRSDRPEPERDKIIAIVLGRRLAAASRSVAWNYSVNDANLDATPRRSRSATR